MPGDTAGKGEEELSASERKGRREGTETPKKAQRDSQLAEGNITCVPGLYFTLLSHCKNVVF